MANTTAGFLKRPHDPTSIDERYWTHNNLDHEETRHDDQDHSFRRCPFRPFFSASTGTALAGNAQSFNRIHGISLDVGAKRAVAYFTNKLGQCRLVITLAGEPNWDTGNLEITRHVESIPAGLSQRYENGGRAFQFGCAHDAQAMTFQALPTVAHNRK